MRQQELSKIDDNFIETELYWYELMEVVFVIFREINQRVTAENTNSFIKFNIMSS